MPEARRALIVDDNATNRMLAKALLSRLGWLTDEVDCGEAALVRVADTDYPLILLDISMPGISGEETCAELRKTGKPMRIIAYTAHAFPEERTKFLAAGFDDILVKPINRQQLETLVGLA
jgi:CheY-like chemotaxis protein